MNPQQIHQSVTSLVPEFSGDETDPAQTATSLAKFLGASDNIYNRLETNDEKEEFNGIIKYRLTGTAFTRIHRRRIKDYPTLKTTLKKMYNPVYSLTELENNYMRIRQQYGESIKSYGYRLSEALDLYKIGYRSKYELANLDDTYTNHLDASSVEIFKRGLTNTILKEKVATIAATNIDKIIEETERIEKILTIITGEPTQHVIPPQPQTLQPTQNQHMETPTRRNQIICNYCQKPNHTWDICRTRIFREQGSRNMQYRTNQPHYRNSPINYQTQRQQNNQYSPQNQYTAPPRQFPNIPTRQITYTPPQQNNFTNYRQPTIPNFQDRPPKYCSHCKTTKGHTFDECRSKFQTNKNYNTGQYRNQPRSNEVENLGNQFNAMKLNTVIQQPMENTATHRQYRNQGNDQGSSQQ